MRIAHNIAALQTTTSLNRANKKVSESTARLASGVRINSAKDDAAGLAVARKLKIQVSGLERASQNATNGISLVQTAEGALTEVNNMLQRMRELAVQSANDTLEVEDRVKIQTEIEGLIQEISDITDRTEFNKVKVLNGQAARLGFSSNANIAEVSYVSDEMIPGQLQYTISKAGLPAQMDITIPGSPGAPLGVEGIITLNGEGIEVELTDSFDDIVAKLSAVGGVVGASVHTNSGKVFITTNEAGAKQTLTLDGDDAVMTAFFGGVGPVEKEGTNADVTVHGFIDKNGNVDDTFNSTMSVRIDGNRIDVVASHGRKVSIDIPIEHDVTGSFKLNKVTIDPDGSLSGLSEWDSTAGGIVMATDIMDYGPLTLQIGPNSGMEMEIIIPKLSAEALGLTKLNYQTRDGATQALKKIDTALADVVRVRSKMGAYQNRLEYTILSLDASAEATEQSRSRIEDTDMAKESTAYTLQQVLVQAGISVLAQANQRPQQVLSLMS